MGTAALEVAITKNIHCLNLKNKQENPNVPSKTLGLQEQRDKKFPF